MLQPVAQIAMPGAAVRFDYQTIDTAANRLYISHMDAGHVVVFDVQNERVVDTIGGLPRVTGVLVVPELGRLYASATGNKAVAVINDTTLQQVTQIGPIGFPDGLAYAPTQQKVYVSDESGGGEVVIDARSNQKVATIPIGGEAGNTVYDAGSGCILVAVQTQDKVAVIDPRTDRVVSQFSPARAAYPHGMLVDPTRRLLFVANENSATLSIVDLRTLRDLGSQTLGAGPDVLAFDPGWRRLYVASESGVVSVFTELDTGLVAEGTQTIPYAHTVATDERSHLVYLPLQDVSGQPMLWIMQAAPPAPSGPARTGVMPIEPTSLTFGYGLGY